MSKKKFELLKSTLAEIAVKTEKLEHLESQAKLIHSEGYVVSDFGLVKDEHLDEMKTQLATYEQKITDKTNRVEEINSELLETKEILVNFEQELVDWKRKFGESMKEKHDIEKKHFDGKTWKQHKQENLHCKIESLEKKIIEIPIDDDVPIKSIWNIFPLLLAIMFVVLLFNGTIFPLECTDGGQKSSLDVWGSDSEECNDDKWADNFMIATCACFIIPILVMLGGNKIARERAQTKNGKVYGKRHLLQQKYVQEFGHVEGMLSGNDSKLKKAKTKIDLLENRIEEIGRFPQEKEELKYQLKNLNNIKMIFNEKIEKKESYHEKNLDTMRENIKTLKHEIKELWGPIRGMVPYGETLERL